MTFGPISFQLPYSLVYRLAQQRLPYTRVYRLSAGAAGMLAVLCWIHAGLNGWPPGLLLAAGCFSALALGLPWWRWWVLRRRVARIPGVASPQQWLFQDDEIVVTNRDGSQIHSPYSVVTTISEDAQYLFLETADGGTSPIPKSALGAFGQTELRRLVASSRSTPEEAGQL